VNGGEGIMHFVSKKVGGYRVFAVSGTNTVSFGIDHHDAATEGLLGFAVERHDPKEDERYFMYGFKVFESLIPEPDENTIVSTRDHPVQSFVWDDFTAKPGRTYEYFFYPLKGKAKNIDRSAKPIPIVVKTEPLYSRHEHDVFFNRGVASSQAYSRKFGNKKPREIADAKKREEALQWLSRDLDDALFKFIDAAKEGDTLLGCFYEFRYSDAVTKFKEAIDRGVNVQLILDAKVNGTADDPSFPREDNIEAVENAKIPKKAIARWRQANPDDIQHNKFIVLLKGAAQKPVAVWTGSTNLSDGGIHGQTNVGHWVRNPDVADAFRKYWELLATDPGAVEGDSRQESTAKRAAFRKAVMELGEVPQKWEEIPKGVTTVFSPRTGSDVLEMYVAMLDQAEDAACITLAFGINKRFKAGLVDNTGKSPVTFFMLEKRDRPNPRAKDPFVPLTAANNVYQAWGSFLRDPIYQWIRETNAKALQLNQHVSYVHSKFLLKDPLGEDPIVVTGSANFSDPSTNSNDENMLLIRGDARAADIYFTEFNRLFFHYYFRSVREAIAEKSKPDSNAAADTNASLFLEEGDGWLKKYKPGSLRQKRVELFTGMASPMTL
jgi:phosphatidylserine/phosphatidylglycerophosphate/cardiolipin synthase-like enzyme